MRNHNFYPGSYWETRDFVCVSCGVWVESDGKISAKGRYPDGRYAPCKPDGRSGEGLRDDGWTYAQVLDAIAEQAKLPDFPPS